MKHEKIKATIALAALCTFGACTSNYLEINSNPYEVDKEQMAAKDYAIAAGLSGMFGAVVSTDVNTAQFTDCLLGGTQGGYYADANGSTAIPILSTAGPISATSPGCSIWTRRPFPT